MRHFMMMTVSEERDGGGFQSKRGELGERKDLLRSSPYNDT